MLEILFIFICILYCITIISFVLGFDKVPVFKLKKTEIKTKFSIIIPFRNEAKSLPELLKSITSLHYDNRYFQIIFVDDNSEDESVEIIKKVCDTILENSGISRTDLKIIKNKRSTNSPKKDAITSAIAVAKYDWIITTDADCILPEYWLDTFNAFILQNNPEMIVAPVAYYNINSFLKRFQALDFLSLMGATIGGFGINKPFLCNGANLAYKKALFKTVNGFDGNTSIASGDDIFLLEKALKNNTNSVQYLKAKSSIVITKPQQSWGELISQRKRWAAKTSHYQSVFGKFVGLVVLVMNASLITSLIIALLGKLNWQYCFVIFVLKLILDFTLLYKTCLFFNQKKHLSSFFISSLTYPFFSVYIAFISLFTSYKWKERRFKK